MPTPTEYTPGSSVLGACSVSGHDCEIEVLKAAIATLTANMEQLRSTGQIAVATGRGCASPEIFQNMAQTNWHGRLGRTHMADVDNMTDDQLTQLDSYLRRTLAAAWPRGSGYIEPGKDGIFLALKDMGLRLEDRVGFADIKVVADNDIKHVGTLRRMRNWAGNFYGNATNTWDNYWKGLSLETLIELGRYRGLFDDEGMLK